VVINGRDPERLDAAARSMRAEGFDVVGVAGSMETEPAAEALVDRAVEATLLSMSSPSEGLRG
jgi:hypothetical protein